jgi:hypothetical protein
VLDHPNQRETNQTPEDFAPDDPRVLAQPSRSVAQADQAEASVEQTRYLLDSPRQPNDSSSYGLDPVLDRSIPDAGPPVPATERRSSLQPWLQGLARQGLATARESNRGDATIFS